VLYVLVNIILVVFKTVDHTSVLRVLSVRTLECATNKNKRFFLCITFYYTYTNGKVTLHIYRIVTQTSNVWQWGSTRGIIWDSQWIASVVHTRECCIPH